MPYRENTREREFDVHAPRGLMLRTVATWAAFGPLLVALSVVREAVVGWLWPSSPAPPQPLHESVLLSLGPGHAFNWSTAFFSLELAAIVSLFFALLGYFMHRRWAPRLTFAEDEVRVSGTFFGRRTLGREDVVLDFLRPRDVEPGPLPKAGDVVDGAVVLRHVDSSKTVAFLDPRMLGFERLIRDLDSGQPLARASAGALECLTGAHPKVASAYVRARRYAWLSTAWLLLLIGIFR